MGVDAAGLKRTVAGLALAACAGVPAYASAADSAASDLRHAAARGDAPRIQALLRSGADANLRDDAGRPVLLLASASGRPLAVGVLLAGGADPDAGDRSGWTPLHEAVERGDLATVRLLLERGAQSDLPSRVRGTPLDLAERAGRAELALLLRSAGARGSGKSIGSGVCVRRWRGQGYCGVVQELDATRVRIRLREVVGCAGGCDADAACSAGRGVGAAGGLGIGDSVWVPASCLSHTGLR